MLVVPDIKEENHIPLENGDQSISATIYVWIAKNSIENFVHFLCVKSIKKSFKLYLSCYPFEARAPSRHLRTIT